ncbi:MAG: SpaA isopeptide-forming pilin-related protein, partial [Ruminococcus bromii]
TEQIIKGEIEIVKHTDQGQTKIETPEEGATFQLFLKSAGSFDKAKDSERDTLICDEKGYAKSKKLPYGTYTVHQTYGWEGRHYVDDFDVFVCDNSKPYSFIINNDIFESYLKVVKVDAESGRTIPYEGAGFQIYAPDNTLITMSVPYPSNLTIDTFYTNSEGYLITPEMLVYDKGYKLVEVQAPHGYVLDSTPITFDITEENSTEEGSIVLTKVNKANYAQKGKITIAKEGEVFYGVNVSGGTDDEGNEIPTIYQPVYETAGLKGSLRIGRLSAILPTISSIT